MKNTTFVRLALIGAIAQLQPALAAVSADEAAQLKTTKLGQVEKRIAKARTRDNMAAFSKLTENVDGRIRIVDQSPLIVPVDKLADAADVRVRIPQQGKADSLNLAVATGVMLFEARRHLLELEKD